MSERRSSIVHNDKPEAMLGALPLPERDWEKMALAVEARLPDTASGSTDAALLAAPFPPEAGEPEAVPLANSGVRTQSLAELARQSLSRDAESDATIAKASLALAARGRAHTEELAEKLRQSAPPPAAAPVDLTDSVQALEEPAQAAAAAPSARISGNQLGYWVGAGGALLAVAAAVALWLRPAPAPLIITQVIEQKDQAPAPVAPAPAAEPKAIDPSALAREGSGTPVTAAAAPATAVALGTPRPATAPGAATASASASSGPAPDKIVLEDDTPSAPLAQAQAPEPAAPAPSTEPAMRPADNTASGSLPTKPSMGAVQSAMSSVMSSARRCLAGETEPSNALVVFGSDGHVSHVTVSGSAAGKPSAACIQAALSKAQTSPFAEASFSFSTVVRP